MNLQALLCAQLPGPSGVEAGERVLIGVRALARMPALLMLLIVSASLKLDWVLGRRFLIFLLGPWLSEDMLIGLTDDPPEILTKSPYKEGLLYFARNEPLEKVHNAF